MTSSKQKGRADAAQGKYAPPLGPLFSAPETDKEALHRREEYREGHYEKRCEMEREKKQRWDGQLSSLAERTAAAVSRSRLASTG